MKKENLSVLGTRLSWKQTHKRKGFREFLSRWEEETAENFRDETLEIVDLLRIDSIEGNVCYFLRRGDDALYRGTDVDAYGYDDATSINVEKMEIKFLRSIISHLPEKMFWYNSLLRKCGKPYDKSLSSLGY